jgi:cell division protease FtsH
VDEETEEDDEPTLGMRARHEAGHCLMAALTWGPASVASVTLRPGATSDGSTVLAEAYTGRRTMSVARVRDELRVRLAGTVAEALLADDEDDISTGAGDDLAQATRLLHHLVGSLGQGSLVGTVHTSTLEGHEGIGSDLMRRSLYLEVMSEAETAYGEAWTVLAEHTDAIRRVADTLLATPGRTLSGETLRALLEAVLTGRTASGTAICARRLVLAPHSGMHRGPNSHASRSRRR